jgi:hypothetical protein
MYPTSSCVTAKSKARIGHLFGGIIMATVAQINANRANAQKSTGPRTPEGKAIVAQNAVRHGLLAQREIIPGEDPGEFALFRDRMREDLGSRGALEGMLADRVVHLAWRLRRAERLECTAWDMLEDQQVARMTNKPAAGDGPDEREAALARAGVEDFRRDKVLERLLGYERRIENSLYRTMGELRKQRVIREGAEEVSSLKCEVSSEDSQTPGSPSLPTADFTLETAFETPDDVSTNGMRDGERSCQTNPIEATGDGLTPPTSEETPHGATTNGESFGETKPICAGGMAERGLGYLSGEEGGRGRPLCEETPGGVSTNGETKPIEVSSGKCQVSSEPG